jgi:hypothetical protein
MKIYTPKDFTTNSFEESLQEALTDKEAGGRGFNIKTGWKKDHETDFIATKNNEKYMFMLH